MEYPWCTKVTFKAKLFYAKYHNSVSECTSWNYLFNILQKKIKNDNFERKERWNKRENTFLGTVQEVIIKKNSFDIIINHYSFYMGDNI